MPLSIDLCCNDYRNGNDLGYAEAVELFDCRLIGGRVTVSLKAERLKKASSAQGDLTLRVGRLVVPCLAYKSWYGNWCWDRATIRLIYLVQIWNYLVKKPDWHCEEGPCELYERFNAHAEIEPRTAPDFLHPILFPEQASGS